jgi:gliding motility-associated lipoprotein GldH
MKGGLQAAEEISAGDLPEKIMAMRTRTGSIFIVLAFVLAGCSSSSVYEKSYDFDHNKWMQNVKPSFSVVIQDTSKAYNYIFTLRTTTEYKYSNLWIYLNSTTPDGQKVREPYEIKLTNPDGTWIGKKTGTIVENTIHFRNKKMPSPGKYVFALEQGITESLIDEVIDIGLIVEKAPSP